MKLVPALRLPRVSALDSVNKQGYDWPVLQSLRNRESEHRQSVHG